MLKTLVLSVLLVVPQSKRTETVFVSVAEAAPAIAKVGITVLDARGFRASPPYLPGAVRIDWLRLRDGWFRTGRLDDDLSSLKAELEKLGISSSRPILVYGAMADGWGEEGRIWWMLRYLGHPEVKILDGGVTAWVNAGLPTANEEAEPTENGRLTVKLHRDHRVDAAGLERDRHHGLVVIDARTAEEFGGATPYFAARGGHIPGAVNLYWKQLIGKNGLLLPSAVIRERVRRLGVQRDTHVAAYCTGGVRSAFVVAALRHAGLQRVANYDGSWWEWASRDELSVERQSKNNSDK